MSSPLHGPLERLSRYHKETALIDQFQEQSNRLVQMLDDYVDRGKLPFTIRLQIEEIERLCRC